MKRVLYGVNKLPFFQKTLKDDKQEEYAKDYLEQQLRQTNFYKLDKEQQILNIRSLIQDKDIRTASKLAIDIGIITRYRKLSFKGVELEDKIFILCTDLTKSCVFFGLIESIFTFDFFESQLPYIQIQLLFDVKTFLLQNLPFNKEVLKFNNKESYFYTFKELIITDQFTFIQLGQVVSRIYVNSPLQYAQKDENQKIGLDQFFNRFKYRVDLKEMELLSIEGLKECEQCKDLIEPQTQLIQLCIKCKKNFIHNKCINDAVQFICSFCDESASVQSISNLSQMDDQSQNQTIKIGYD